MADRLPMPVAVFGGEGGLWQRPEGGMRTNVRNHALRVET